MEPLSSSIRSRPRLVALFVAMVLLPAVVFGALIVRAARTERIRQEFETARRQRQIVRLVEADLTNWLFAAGGAEAEAILHFEVQQDRIAFPAYGVALSASDAPAQRPFDTGPPQLPPTPQSITQQYFPRVVAFRRDLHAGRNKGAQFFPRLSALVVQPPAVDRGYIIDIQAVLTHVNGKLAELADQEPFAAQVWIREERTSQPPAEGVTLDGFSFFDVTFSAAGAPAWPGAATFPYSISLVVLVTILGSVLLYRGISQEARLARLRNDFVAAVSHEFRSPLSSILALTERLERVRDDDHRREYHRIIGQDAHRLHALVTRLLDFALIEDGRKAYAFERVDLTAVAREAIEACRHVASPERIALARGDAAPLWVRADRTALHHAIQNVIDNAAKYSSPDSPIVVECMSSNGSHVVAVRDSGVGIPAAEQERIFDKFYRGRHVAGSNVQGIGIGLALVRHVVESHGGSIALDSRPGEGTTVSLQLPALEA